MKNNSIYEAPAPAPSLPFMGPQEDSLPLLYFLLLLYLFSLHLQGISEDRWSRTSQAGEDHLRKVGESLW